MSIIGWAFIMLIGGAVVYYMFKKAVKAVLFAVSMGVFYLILKYVVGVF